MSDDQSPPPPEFEWEQMQAGIFDKLEALEASVAQEKSGKRNRAMLLLLLLLLLLIPILCNPRLYKEVSVSASTQIKQEMEEPQDVNISNTSDLHYEQTDLPRINKQNPTTQQKLDSKRPNILADVKATKKVLPVDITQAQPKASSENQMNITSPMEVDKLPIKAFTLVNELENRIDVQPALIAIVEEEKQERKKDKTKRLILEGGVTMWSPNFGDNKPERAAFETAVASYSGQVNYIQPLKNNFILSIGFQYQRLESRFDYTQQIEEYTIILEDTIVEVQNNLITGQSQAIRGDVELTVPAERVIQHYNSINLYQLPIAVGKTWTSKKWQKDLLIGTSLNLLTSNTGRTFYADNIIDYDGTSTAFLRNQWAVNASLSGRLTYQLNDHWGLSTSIQVQRSLNNWSQEEGIKMFPSIVNWSLGASCSF